MVIFAWIGSWHVANAQLAQAVSGYLGLQDLTIGFALQVIGYLIYFALTIVSFGLSLAAVVLNFAMYLTTHLGVFINNTPAIFQIWGTVRDLATMVLIFLILIAAIQMILDLKPASWGTLIKNIVIAGILINFSFFFTRVLIDASNIVSLEFYNAMSSSASLSSCENNAGVNTYITCSIGAITSINGNGGIANVFMGALDVTQWWGNKGQLQNMGTRIDAGIRLILINSAAIVVTIFAGLSFIGAAAAALWRVVILILLLAFSPLWIAGFVLPQIQKEMSGKWWNHLKANLIFLPVYLFLTYVVVQLMMAMNLSSLGQQTGLVGTTGTYWYVPYLQLFVGFAVSIFLINIPLATALQFSGASGTITGKFSNWARSRVGEFIGRNTAGQAAYALNKSGAVARLAAFSPATGMMVSKGLSKVSSAGFGGKKGGYDAALKKEKKDIEAMHKRLGEVERSDYTTDAEFNAAKERAERAQEGFRQNLPKRSVFYGMLTSRGARESATKLSRDSLADNLKKNYGKRAEINAKIKEETGELDKQIAYAQNIAEATEDESELEKVKSLKEQRAKIVEKYQKQLDEIQKDIDEGEKVKGGKDMAKLAKALQDKLKEEEGGGGERKEEKPKT